MLAIRRPGRGGSGGDCISVMAQFSVALTEGTYDQPVVLTDIGAPIAGVQNSQLGARPGVSKNAAEIFDPSVN